MDQETRFANGYLVPHYHCYRAAKHFRRSLYELGRQSGAGVANPQLRDFLEQSVQFVALAESVQIFAALAVEGALNLCAIMAVGQTQFYGGDLVYRRQRKVELIVAHATESDTIRDEELRALTKRVADARNYLVHPRPQELPVETDSARSPGWYEEVADRALTDAERVIQLLGRVNPRWTPMVSIV
jgi:hypothetical protein